MDANLSHNNSCFQCNIAITNFFVSHSHMREDFMMSYVEALYIMTIIYTHKNSKTWPTCIGCFGPLFFYLIRWIQLSDKKNLTFIDCCEPKACLISFLDSSDKILSQQLTHDRSYISLLQATIHLQMT